MNVSIPRAKHSACYIVGMQLFVERMNMIYNSYVYSGIEFQKINYKYIYYYFSVFWIIELRDFYLFILIQC